MKTNQGSQYVKVPLCGLIQTPSTNRCSSGFNAMVSFDFFASLHSLIIKLFAVTYNVGNDSHCRNVIDNAGLIQLRQYLLARRSDSNSSSIPCASAARQTA